MRISDWSSDVCSSDLIGRHVDRKPAIAADLARVQPVIDHADAEEERGRDDAVAEHDDQRAFDPLLIKGIEARGDDRHVRDRRIGDQLFHEIGRAHVELQSLMRISYAVFCLQKKTKKNNTSTSTITN